MPEKPWPTTGQGFFVGITISDQVRYCTITRKRLLQFAEAEQQEILRALYKDKLMRLQNAFNFCLLYNIKLYRCHNPRHPIMAIHPTDNCPQRLILLQFGQNSSIMAKRRTGVR